MFLSIDGGDGTGKSTQLVLLCQWLQSRGREVVRCRDPGSTPLGEAVRELFWRLVGLSRRMQRDERGGDHG